MFMYWCFFLIYDLWNIFVYVFIVVLFDYCNLRYIMKSKGRRKNDIFENVEERGLCVFLCKVIIIGNYKILVYMYFIFISWSWL